MLFAVPFDTIYEYARQYLQHPCGGRGLHFTASGGRADDFNFFPSILGNSLLWFEHTNESMKYVRDRGLKQRNGLNAAFALSLERRPVVHVSSHVHLCYALRRLERMRSCTP